MKLYKCFIRPGNRCMCGKEWEAYPWGELDLSHTDRCPNFFSTWLNNNHIDWLNTSRLYWKNIFARAEKETYMFIEFLRPEEKACSTTKRLKHIRYNYRMSMLTKCFKDHKYGPEIDAWIQVQIEQLEKETGDNCIDNHRWAEKNCRPEMKRYRNAVKHGCCGFADKEITHPETGRIFMVGFNYGH